MAVVVMPLCVLGGAFSPVVTWNPANSSWWSIPNPKVADMAGARSAVGGGVFGFGGGESGSSVIETGPKAVDDITRGASEDAVVVVGGVVESSGPGAICAEGSVFPGCSGLGESEEGVEGPVVVCARVATGVDLTLLITVEISGGWL